VATRYYLNQTLFRMARHSLIIPVLNEAESLSQLYQEIDQTAADAELEIEIIFVDDGSTDNSWQQIQSLCHDDPRVRGIQFRRNFGKAAALDAGIHASTGEIVITLDADLQDDPKEIPQLLSKFAAGFEVVSGWKQVRHDPWHKTMPSKVFNFLVGLLTGVKLHDHNCGFKCYDRRVFDDVELYGERHRFIPVLAAAFGWKVTEQVVQHRPRQFGKSKYGFTRFVKGLLDLMAIYFLTGFRNRPLHLLGTLGICSFAVGAIGLFYLAVYWVVRVVGDFQQWEALHQRPLVIYSLGALLLGAQLISIGFLAELITSQNRRFQKAYSLKSTANLSPEVSTSESQIGHAAHTGDATHPDSGST
jgi:dolichol-phosphate mannosyltransferase